MYAKRAVGFGAQLDPADRIAAFGVGCSPVGAVEEGAFIIAADLAVGDRDVVGTAGGVGGEAAFEADAVVRGGVDQAVGDADVAAGVDVIIVLCRHRRCDQRGALVDVQWILFLSRMEPQR